MPRPGEIDAKNFLREKRKQKERKIPMLNKNLYYATPKEYANLTGKHLVTIYGWLVEGLIEGALKLEGEWKIPVKGQKSDTCSTDCRLCTQKSECIGWHMTGTLTPNVVPNWPQSGESLGLMLASLNSTTIHRETGTQGRVPVFMSPDI